MLATVSGAVTHLGSSTLLFPLTACYATILWRRRSGPLALRWLAAVALCLGIIGGLKLLGHGCGLPPFPFLADDRFVSPSGHAAFAAVFYGSVGGLAARGIAAGGWRIVVLLATAGLIAAVGLSRIMVSAHSGAEVVAGLLVGGLAVALFLWSCRSFPPASPRVSPLGLAAVALGLVVLVRIGDPSIIEPAIRKVAASLRTDTGLCVVSGAATVDVAGAGAGAVAKIHPMKIEPTKTQPQ